MKVILKNPSLSIINQVSAKEGLTIDLSDYENELFIEDVIYIKDMTRYLVSTEFALYKKDIIIYVDNSDFSEMEVRL